MSKELAMDNDGNLSWCTVPADQRGSGKCNHIGHTNENESASNFAKRMEAQNTNSENNTPSLKASQIPELIRTSKLFKGRRTQQMRVYNSYMDYAFDQNGELKDPKNFFRDVAARGFVGDGKEIKTSEFEALISSYGFTMKDIDPES